MKLGQKRLLFTIYCLGLCLSLGLSFYSYNKQKNSLGYINELFRHYNHKEINFLTLELYQKKLNLVTQGLLGKNDNWRERTTEVQNQLISLIKDQQNDDTLVLIEKQKNQTKFKKIKRQKTLLPS